MEYKFLNNIESPEDLKKLNNEDISLLSLEIREFLIETLQTSGGHLASNLGVVELTLAMHSVFDSPSDHFIFDVGHQAYVHKLITGRREQFTQLRKPGGLSGFTKTSESEHDPFGAGHSSTSISAGLGFAEADHLAGRKNYTVCLVGDGAFTGGMIHEALNNCRPELPMVIILNENGMSISSNKGAFASYLSKVRISRGYRNFKEGTISFLEKIPLVGKPIKNLFSLTKRVVKNILYKPNYFEQLGLYYIGPIDGNDYLKVKNALTLAKQTGKTCIVHVKTTKGKGYSPAESFPDEYHSVSSTTNSSTYHSVFADQLIMEAEKREKILAVTAAMGIGTGLSAFGEKFPERYFDVGIAESHALTFAAGLAANGFTPYVAIYSTFLQRGYDNLLHDVALQNLPVKIFIDRAGLAASDGATHHGIFDVSFISHIPGVTLFAPSSFSSLRELTALASEIDGPVAIRYSNSSERTEDFVGLRPLSAQPLVRVYSDFENDDPAEYIFITYGSILKEVRGAQTLLNSKGIKTSVILLETLKPLDKVADHLIDPCRKAKKIVFVEEGIKSGGAAERMRSQLIDLGLDLSKTEFKIAAIDDTFVNPDKPCNIYDYAGLSAEKLCKLMTN